MTTTENLQEKERIILELRALYRRYGYSGYKMSRFEEYDLYVRNKDFLSSDRMIVFTDLDGTLMALKPDVTISIIKNTSAEPGTVKKVYYDENVFRADAKAGSFKEIMQTGLECIGDIDRYQLCEVLHLAAGSLQAINGDYMLDISHLGLVSGALLAAGVPAERYGEALALIRDKNRAGLLQFCRAGGYDDALLPQLVATYGDANEVLAKLRGLCRNGEMQTAFDELQGICTVLAQGGLAGRVQIDFSVVNDMNYYNGIIFQGFINGIPTAVLRGGQYDRLMAKMGRAGSGAVGFAVYLDELETHTGAERADVDVLLLYRPGDDVAKLDRAVRALTAQGKTVSAQRVKPAKLRCNSVLRLEDWRGEDE
ncbi:MAG: hypothetical protein PWQ08_934 [Clostridiales bacterium]|jgi:ATP phosphoribosyltransferase regulatory subunit|nr:hypothetical protein [Clostridiales bacterium]